EEIFGANLREVLIKANDYRLLNTQHAQCFDLLIESLQEGRRRFGMEQCARMGVESEHRRHSACCPGPFDYCLHDELVPEMQAVEHAQRKNRGSRDFGVVGTVEKSHPVVQLCPGRIFYCFIYPSPFSSATRLIISCCFV